MPKNINQKIKELTLLLLWLTSWKEEARDIEIRRSWKGYNFDALDKLSEEGLIGGSHRSKSAYLTDEGIKEARKLEKKYLDKN